MKILRIANLVVLVLLSISSGISKIILLPQEVEFFGGAGYSNTLIIMYGAAQLAGAVLLIFRKARIAGAATMAVTFAISTIVIFANGNVVFGLVSILPILMAGFILTSARDTHG